ncbi:DUF4031 domain-containing protein [Xanthocytophaga agilis]|uniref:DUF4031 domain-containing protein n=1 Tax=Xanthocytophaga agilis TaxID=3048010 RepID=A0AAE3R354_9BACT|nr:DUF4031 domain-containing protein [Xanthocytophaga agilis]MDJ1500484.1 DUF4031 domain-containing protein [Xanthocytophaga agilis]
MIYTDGIHMVADSLQELHEFAQSLGVKKCWFEGVRKGHPHYDLAKVVRGKVVRDTEKVRKAMEAGAIKISSKELLLKSKSLKTW